MTDFDSTETPDTLRDETRAVELLRRHGPLDEDQWTALLVDHGFDEELAEDLVLDPGDGSVAAFPDGRLAVVDGVVARCVLTHRLAADEIAADILDAMPDLDPLILGLDDPRAAFTGLGGGSALPSIPADPVFAERNAEALAERIDHGLIVPRGSLARFRPGDLVAVRLDGDDGLLVEACTEPAELDLRPLLAAAIPEGGRENYEVIIWQAMWDEGLFRTPCLPIGELIDDAGYVRRTDYIAHAGFDFDAHRLAIRTNALAAQHGLDETEARAVVAISDIAMAAPDERDAMVRADLDADRAVFDPLYEFEVAEALVAVIDERSILFAGVDVDSTADGPGQLGAMYQGLEAAATFIARRAPKRARGGALYVAGMAAVRSHDLVGAEEHLRDAVEADPTWEPAVRALAVLALIRTDLDRARSLLTGMVDHHHDPLFTLLEDVAAAGGPEPGRNDPCWCGSGRKFKKCHRGSPRITPAQHNSLLYAKSIEFLGLTAHVQLLSALVELRSAQAPESVAAELQADPLAADVVLFEGGVLEMFLATAGPILPDQDALLARQWLLAGRSVFDVEDVRYGEGMTLRDLHTGDRYEISEESASRQIRPGAYICTRVVPEGDTHVLYGGAEPVEPHRRGELIELLDGDADPAELVEFLSARFAPPQIMAAGDTDAVDSALAGAEMVLCRAEYTVADTAGIRRKLSRRYGKPDVADEWDWLDGTRVLGVVRLAADQFAGGAADGGLVLSVEASTERRFEQLMGQIAEMDPQAALLDEERRSVNDMLAAGEFDTKPDGAAGAAAVGPLGAAAGGSAGAIASGRGSRAGDGAAGMIDPQDMPPEMREAVADLMRDYEAKWPDEPLPALGGQTPRQAAEDPTTRDDVVRLLDTFPQTDRADMMSGSRLKKALGL